MARYKNLVDPSAEYLAEDIELLITPPRDRQRSDMQAIEFLIFKRQLAKRIYQEMQSREIEALRLYEPMPTQERFHASNAKMRLLRGGNRSGKCQPVTEPVLTPFGWYPIGDLLPGDEVFGSDGRRCKVVAVYPQGEKEVFKLTFDDGAYTRCCEDHLWKVRIGKRVRFGAGRLNDEWSVKTLREIRQHGGDEPVATKRAAIPVAIPDLDCYGDTPIPPYLLGALLGDGSICRKHIGFTSADPEILDRVRREIPKVCRLVYRDRYDYAIRSKIKGGNALVAELRELGLMGKYAWTKHIPHAYLWGTRETRIELLRGLMDTDGSVTAGSKGQQTVEYCTTSPQLAKDVQFLVRSLGGKCRISWRTTHYTYKGEKKAGRRSARVRISMRDLNPFWVPRKADKWKPQTCFVGHRILRKIEPAGRAECVCIQVDSPDNTYITRDFIVTHNTASGAVEVARAATGQDPHNKYQTFGLRIMCVGREAEHSRIFYRKIFGKGAFKVLHDENGRPFVVNESDPAHLALKHKWRPAEPLIPARFIAEIAWERRNRDMPKMVRLINDVEIHFASGQGKPKRGSDFDLIWFDEEIEDPEWYPEALTRLIDRDGKFIWTATPQSATAEMYDLFLQAQEQSNDENPSAEDFCIRTTENFHLPKASIEQTIKGIRDEEERRVRIDGDFKLEGVIVYSGFNKHLHCVSEHDDLEDGQPLMPNGAPRADWSLYIAVDPGVSPLAALFVGVPPTGGRFYVFDELYIRKASAQLFGEQLELKIKNWQMPELFIIDVHGSKLTDLGSGQSPLTMYRDQLRTRNLKCRIMGHDFWAGADNEQVRINSCKTWLPIDDVFKAPRLAVVHERCPNFLAEIGKYAHVRRPNGTIDDRTRPGWDHLMDCWGMIAAYGPKWTPPASRPSARTGIWEAFQREQAREAAKKRSTSTSLGPVGQN